MLSLGRVVHPKQLNHRVGQRKAAIRGPSAERAKAQTGREALEEPRIERVLRGLRPPIAIKGQPPVRWKLADRMADSHVPGLSVAVIDDGKIAWARGFGVREAGTNEPVTHFNAV